ncbi:MAG: glutaredoxin domain-containing protein [Candidatus Sedimenticola sp. (ex Thyasira tokunagai)]
MNAIDIIRQEIMCNPVLIFMKGSPKQPKCPYSRNAVNALISTNLPFSHVDLSQTLEIQQALPKVADWPTFPQIFIDGKLIGGGDAVVELNEAGKLKPMMEAAINKAAG